MANPNYNDILTTTIESRSKSLADNVSKNTALLFRLQQRGRIRTFSGGVKILEELAYQENPNYKRYSGYETLPTAQGQQFTSAEYMIRQVAVAVPISGLEELQNAGPEQMIDLVASRVENAETTMTNGLSGDLYSDGTADGGKQIDGLQAAVADNPTTGVYGGIDRATNTFWRNYAPTATAISPTTVQGLFNDMDVNTTRNRDSVDLIACDNAIYTAYWGSLQPQQRFMDPALAELGFRALKFKNADVILDGGIGGSIPANHAYFLNTNHISWRPHSRRNMVPLNPDRYSINQDAVVKLIGFAGNLTTRVAFLQGVLQGT